MAKVRRGANGKLTVEDMINTAARAFSLDDVESVLFHSSSPILEGLALPACREFLHETFIADDNGVFSGDEIRELHNKLVAAANQKKIKKPVHISNVFEQSRIEGKYFKVVDHINALHDYRGIVGWPTGTMQFHPDSSVDLEFDDEVFLTKVHITTRNPRTSPKGIGLYVEDEVEGWKLVHTLQNRPKTFLKHEPRLDYEKYESFYLFGDAAGNSNPRLAEWEAHPLTSPGAVISSPERCHVAKRWRIRFIGQSEEEIIELYDVWFFGMFSSEVPPAPQNVAVTSEMRSAHISWDPPTRAAEEDIEITKYLVLAYPGGSGSSLKGCLYEECLGTSTELSFPGLAPKAGYSFQVVAIGPEDQRGIPSVATPFHSILGDWEYVLDDDVPRIDYRAENALGRSNTPSKFSRSAKFRSLQSSLSDLDLPGDIHFSAKVQQMLAGEFKCVKSINSSRCVTVYISGTPDDTKSERDQLMEFAYPYARAQCQAQGLEFNAIDLRWGIGKQSSIDDDHSIVQVHMTALERCIQNSAAAGFLYLSTETYGYRGLPAAVPVEEMDKLLGYLQEGPSKDVLVSWYIKDENSIPLVYILQPVSKMVEQGYAFLDDPTKGVRGDQSIMQELVMNVATSQDDISREVWVLGLSEREVRRVLLGPASHEKISQMCVVRTIDGLDKALADEQDQALSLQKARIFAAMNGSDRNQMKELREEVCKAVAGGDQKKLTLPWSAVGDSDLSAGYLGDLSSMFIKRVEGMIIDATSGEQNLTSIVKEAHHHLKIALEKSDSFIGRETVKVAAKACIAGSDHHIAVIYGDKGSGRTSLLCQVAVEAHSYLPKTTKVVIRLCGATSESSSAREILQSLCMQIAILYPSVQKYEIPTAFEELVDVFRDFLQAATLEEPLAIFIDGLENLSNANSAISKPWTWLPRKLPANVCMVVSTVSDASVGILQVLQSGLSDRGFVEVPKLEVDECHGVLNAWLKKESRSLTQEQMATVEKYIFEAESSMSMIHIKLLFDHVAAWRSYEEPSDLPSSVGGFIHLIFDELEKKHGAPLVAKLMQFILASKNGLTEQNVLDLISADDLVLGKKREPGTVLENYDPSVRRMPPMVLARLKRDLSKQRAVGIGSGAGSYLAERTANEVTVLTLYHQQFVDVAKERYLREVDQLSTVSWILAEYFSGDMAEQFPDRNIDPQPIYFGTERTPNRQRLDELPWALLNSGEYGELADLLCDLEYVEAKCCAGPTFASDLLEEYTQAMAKAGANELSRLIQYHRFVYIWFSILSGSPKATAGLASNYVMKSVVARDAQERWKSRTETRPWLKWHNAPRVYDPIISTNRFFKQEELISCALQPGTTTAVITGYAYCTVIDAYFRKEICTVRDHTGWVWDSCFSPDGRLVLSVSGDCTGLVWTANEGRVVEKLVGHTGWVLGCAWSPKDNVVLTVSTDRTGRLWNPYFGYLVGVLVGHQAPVKCGTFSPLGESVFTAALDGEVICWAVESSEPMKQFMAHTAPVNCIDWSAASNVMATASDDGTVILWDSDQHALHTLRDHRGPVRSCSFSDDGKEIVTVGADSFGYVHSVQTGEPTSKLSGHKGQIVDCDWEGRYIFTVSEDKTANVWEREFLSHEHIQDAVGPAIGRISAMKFTGSTANDLCLHLLDDQLRYFVQRQPFLETPLIQPQQICKGKPAYFFSADLSADASTWAYGSETDFTFLFSAKSGKQVGDLHGKIGGPNIAVAWHPQDKGSLLIGGGKVGRGALKLMNIKTRKVLLTFDTTGLIQNVVWSANGQRIASTGPTCCQLWDLEGADTQNAISSVATFDAGTSACISPDSDRAAFVLSSGAVIVYDIPSAKTLCKIRTLADDAGPITFSVDGSILYVGRSTQEFGNPSIEAYDVLSGTNLAVFYSPYSSEFSTFITPPLCSAENPFFVAGDNAGRFLVLELQQRK